VNIVLLGVTAPMVITSSNTDWKFWWKLNSLAEALTASTFLRVA